MVQSYQIDRSVQRVQNPDLTAHKGLHCLLFHLSLLEALLHGRISNLESLQLIYWVSEGLGLYSISWAHLR